MGPVKTYELLNVFNSDDPAELPDAPPEPWIVKYPGAAKGVLTQITLVSKILSEERTLAVYTPSAYDPKGNPHGLLIVFDGESYGSREHSAVPMPTILENVAAAIALVGTSHELVHHRGRSR